MNTKPSSSPLIPTPGETPWVVAGPPGALAHLRPLIEARRARQPVVVLPCAAEAVLQSPRDSLPENTAGLLVVGPLRRSPGRMLPGLFVQGRRRQRVPVGWLPDAGPRLATYAIAAARALERADDWRSLAVLGQWEDRFLRVCLRAARWFEKEEKDFPVFQWTADRISREHLVAGLAHGPGVAMYFGHGRPRGWAGYHGVRGHDFGPVWPEPIGALLAVCCENASRHRTGLSFIEDLALRGVFAGAMAAVTTTRHDHNRIWGPALCEALGSPGVTTLAQLIETADVPPRMKEHDPFRFIGDPLAPLAGARDAAAQAAKVFAPAPDDPLPAWEETA